MLGRRAKDVAGLALGLAVLLGTGVLARRRVTPSEVRVFRWANELTDDAYRGVWVPMQYGTFAAVPALSSLALARRRPDLAVVIAMAGTGAWVLAKAVKPVVGRGRPAAILGDIHQRGKEEGDLGFPSGHAAVSAALTLVAWRDIGPGRRLVSAMLSGFVPFARMYVGAHLPLDVIGGSALGVCVASLVDLVFGATVET